MTAARDVTISPDHAAVIARDIRDEVAECYRCGTLNEFARGMFQGQLTMVRVYMRPEKWIMQGIENEVDFYCRRTNENARRA